MSPEDKIYQKLLIKGSKEKLPEGWGRSETSAGVQVSRAKNKAEVNPQVFMDNHKQNLQQGNEEIVRDSSVMPDDYALTSGDFTPDANGFIGDYHKDDLMKQFQELQAKGGLNDLLLEIESEKDIDDPQRKEANRFLEYAIRGGLSQ